MVFMIFFNFSSTDDMTSSRGSFSEENVVYLAESNAILGRPHPVLVWEEGLFYN